VRDDRVTAGTVLVQRVSTWWTVASRGGPGATARNAVPVAFALPAGMVGGLHEVVVRERDGFGPEVRQVAETGAEAGALMRGAGLPLHVVDGMLRVRPPPAVRLAEGQWLRWQINYRIIGTHGGPSAFLLETFNVLHGRPASAEVFLGVPTRSVDERAYLR
jgi:hypothetical protein